MQIIVNNSPTKPTQPQSNINSWHHTCLLAAASHNCICMYVCLPVSHVMQISKLNLKAKSKQNNNESFKSRNSGKCGYLSC